MIVIGTRISGLRPRREYDITSMIKSGKEGTYGTATHAFLNEHDADYAEASASLEHHDGNNHDG